MSKGLYMIMFVVILSLIAGGLWYLTDRDAPELPEPPVIELNYGMAIYSTIIGLRAHESETNATFLKRLGLIIESCPPIVYIVNVEILVNDNGEIYKAIIFTRVR